MFQLTLDNVKYYRTKYLINVKHRIKHLLNIRNRFFNKC